MNASSAANPPAPDAPGATSTTVLNASHRGNLLRVAEKLHRQLESRGLAARLVNIADFRPRDMALEELPSLVVSTHGAGDPPDDARAFVDFLGSRKTPLLPLWHYTVLALGDSRSEALPDRTRAGCTPGRPGGLIWRAHLQSP